MNDRAPLEVASAGSRSQDSGKRPCDLLIHHSHVVTMDESRTVLADGAVAVTGDRIVEVGSSNVLRNRYDAHRQFDAGGGLVRPGFVDPHYHVTLHSGRSLFVTKASKHGGPSFFDSWLNELREEDEHDSALAAFTEGLCCGFTAMQDPGTAMAPDAIAEAANAAGIRLSLTDPNLWDQEGASPTARPIPFDLKRCMRLLGGQLWRNRDSDTLVRGHIGVYGMSTASDELLVAAKDCARQNGVVFASHQSVFPDDAQYDRDRFGQPPLLHFADLGILDSDTVFTHMNCIDESEADAVAASAMTVNWNPTNYFFYAINRDAQTWMPNLLERGAPVALCNDIAKAWGFADEQLIAYFAARSVGLEISIPQLLQMLTLNGARAIGQGDEIGRLETGRRADIVVHRVDDVLSQPNTDPELQALLVSRAASVDTVLVAGRTVVQGGHCVTIDEEAVFAHERESVRRVTARIGP